MSASTTDKKREALNILGLPQDPDQTLVRRAFRRLARTSHPDLHNGHPEMERRFKRLNSAYRFLMASSEVIAPHLRENSRPPPRQGSDLYFRLRIAFLQAALGGEVSLRYSRQTPCPGCGGTGGTSCTRCGGRKEIVAEAVTKVRIPPGIEEGESLCIRYAGCTSRCGGASGDLCLSISIREHPLLKRKGSDIFSEAKVPRSSLVKGVPISVLTIHGPNIFPLPPGTHSGRIFQLRGLGIAKCRGVLSENGDHFVRIEMAAPEEIGEKRRGERRRGQTAAGG